MLSLRKGLADLCFTPVSHVLKWMLLLFNIEKSCFHCWVSEFGTVPCEVFSSVGWLSLTTALCAASLSRSWPRFLEGLPCSCICQCRYVLLSSLLHRWEWNWRDRNEKQVWWCTLRVSIVDKQFKGWFFRLGRLNPVFGDGLWGMNSWKGKNSDKSRGWKGTW